MGRAHTGASCGSSKHSKHGGAVTQEAPAILERAYRTGSGCRNQGRSWHTMAATVRTGTNNGVQGCKHVRVREAETAETKLKQFAARQSDCHNAPNKPKTSCAQQAISARSRAVVHWDEDLVP